MTGVLGSEVREVVGPVLSETPHLVYSSVDGYLGCFCHLAIVMNMVCKHLFESLLSTLLDWNFT